MTKASDEEDSDEAQGEQLRRSKARIFYADQEARDIGNEAMSRIDIHETLCTERWQSQKDAMVRVEKAMAEIKAAVDDKIGKLPAGLIAALTGICGYLAARAFPIH